MGRAGGEASPSRMMREDETHEILGTELDRGHVNESMLGLILVAVSVL